MKLTKKLMPLAIMSTMSVPAMMAAAPAQAEITGNLSVVSKYVFRGGFVLEDFTVHENNNTAMQGGLDYAHESGFYAGYWGSNLDYGDDAIGFENDFYIGFGGDAGAVSYDIGLVQYLYLSIDDADVFEIYGSVGLGPVSLGLSYLGDDVVWGNQGDIYWSLGYEAELPDDFSFSATLGFYTYETDGEFIPDTDDSEDSGFKHLDLTLSHPLADTGADMSITYMVGGDDRFGESIEDTVILGLSMGF